VPTIQTGAIKSSADETCQFLNNYLGVKMFIAEENFRYALVFTLLGTLIWMVYCLFLKTLKKLLAGILNKVGWAKRSVPTRDSQTNKTE
jgi:hypothetical protein